MNVISDKIGFWYDENRRDLPWRQTRDAYKIWLSEIILQQTRVAQGMDYYLKFVEAYPTVAVLAKADEDEVLKLWQGLGYYSRARNLLKAARQVMDENGGAGTFPTTYDALLRLKGVGRYTAAAVASLAADEEVAVVDGNVYRVLSRLYDIAEPIDSTTGQRLFQQLADEMLHEAVGSGHSTAGRHNQAMMELGALQCTPTQPQCTTCCLADHCLALSHGTVGERPVKAGRVKVRERHIAYIIYIYKDTLWVHQRGAGDIWQGLWEFVGIEQEKDASAYAAALEQGIPILTMRHQLTHQTLYADFRLVRLDERRDDQTQHPDIKALDKDYERITWREWQSRAVPRLIDEANKRLSDWIGSADQKLQR